MKIYNKIYLLAIAAICIGSTAKAQVKIGDNPTVIGPSSLLELESKNKALLLTRVADTTKIAVPVSGMMVYDISRGCITGYQNGKWSPCKPAAGCPTINPSTSSWATGLQFGQIASNVFNSNLTGQTFGVTLKGNVYGWGYNWPGYYLSTMQSGTSPSTANNTYMCSPVWQNSPLFNGIAQKVQTSNHGGSVTVAVLTTAASGGKLCMWGNENNSFGIYAGHPASFTSVQPVQITPPTGTSYIKDMCLSVDGQNVTILDDLGRVWWCGTGIGAKSYAINNSPPYYNSWQPVAFPSGVISYAKIWTANTNYFGNGTIFMLGNDNNLYVTGTNAYAIFGNGLEGTSGTTSSTINYTEYDPSVPAGIQKVNLPAGTVVTKIFTQGLVSITAASTVMALTTTGQLYAWGRYDNQTGTLGNFSTASTPFQSTTYNAGNLFLNPVPVTLPPGESSFVDFAISSNYQNGSSSPSIILNMLSFYICGSGKIYQGGTTQNYNFVDGMKQHFTNLGQRNANTYTPFYQEVDATSGLSVNNIFFNGFDSYLWNSSNGTLYTFGPAVCGNGSGYPTPTFPAQPLLSGFKDFVWTLTPSTNSNTTGSNPYPGPGY